MPIALGNVYLRACATMVARSTNCNDVIDRKRIRVSLDTYRKWQKLYRPFWIVAVGIGPPLAPIRKSSGSDS